MDKIKYIKLEQEDGSFSDPIPLSASSDYILMDNGNTLEETIGNIEVENNGSIAEQLAAILQRLEEIEQILEGSI